MSNKQSEELEHYRLEGAAWILDKLLRHPHEDINHLMVEEAYKQTHYRLSKSEHPTPLPPAGEVEGRARELVCRCRQSTNYGNHSVECDRETAAIVALVATATRTAVEEAKTKLAEKILTALELDDLRSQMGGVMKPIADEIERTIDAALKEQKHE